MPEDKAMPLEDRAAEWVRTRLGPEHMAPIERAMRLFEEASELAQSEGVTPVMANTILMHVYSRPPGNARQEAGGVATTLLMWCAATGNRLEEITLDELERIESKHPDEIESSVSRKLSEGIIHTANRKHQPFEYD
jgi:hypothetical protein